MSYGGIDLSTKAIDIVTLNEDDNYADHFRVRIDLPSGATTTERARRLRDRMPARTAWLDAGVTLLAIEEPFFAGSPMGLAPLLVVYGGLLQLLPAALPLLELRADDWRKECGLAIRKRKNLPDDQLKRASVAFAREQWKNPPAALDHNAAEAFCAAYAAREIDIRTGQLSRDAVAL